MTAFRVAAFVFGASLVIVNSGNGRQMKSHEFKQTIEPAMHIYSNADWHVTQM